MKIEINKTGAVAIHEDFISFTAKGPIEDKVDAKEVESAKEIIFYIDSDRIYCSPESATVSKGSITVRLHTKKSMRVVEKLWDRINKTIKEECFLFIPEKVNAQLFEETKRLLAMLSKKRGVAEEDLLYELTTFPKGDKTIKGKKDLSMVSESQMQFIKDKMKTELEIKR